MCCFIIYILQFTQDKTKYDLLTTSWTLNHTFYITGVPLGGLAAGHSVVADAGCRDAVWLLLILMQMLVLAVVLVVAEMVVERQTAFVLGQHERRRRGDRLAWLTEAQIRAGYLCTHVLQRVICYVFICNGKLLKCV